MPRRLRFVPPGSLVEITCRTVQGRLLLRPSARLREITLGVLARSARLYPVQVHAFAFLSNHYHLLVTPESAEQLALFMGYFNSNLAREAGRIVRWREKFWGRRYQAILVSDEEASQVGRLRYVLAHGVKEGFVRSPLEWPGAHSAAALVADGRIFGSWIDHTLEYRAQQKGRVLSYDEVTKRESLRLVPIPCWKHLSAESYRGRIRDLLRQIEADGKRDRKAREVEAAGPDFILRQDPRHEPNRLKRGPAPLVHAASRRVRDELRESYRVFVRIYRQAAGRFQHGALDALFPAGAFPPRLGAVPFGVPTSPG